MRSRLWKLIGVLIGVGLVISACGILPTASTPDSKDVRATAHAEVQSQLALVCQGTPFSAAAPYAGSSLHPAVLVDQDSNWSDQIPESWFPDVSEEAQLIVCVEQIQDVSLEVCPYFGSDITRYRRDLPVRILEARTGKLVAQKTFIGSDPRHCQATENVNTTVLYGETVSHIKVETWFRQYVESGEASFQPAAKDVNVYCGFWGDSPQVLEVDQMVSLYWQWTATTDEYRQDYMDAITFFLRLDGEPVDISSADRSLDVCEAENWPCVTWRLAPIFLQPGTHEIVMTEVFNRDIQDGFDMDEDGNLDTYSGEWVREPACEIIVP